MTLRSNHSSNGLVIRELLILVALAVCLVLLLLLTIRFASRARKQSGCLNNLREIGVAFHIASSQSDRFPQGMSTNEGQIEIGLLRLGQTNAAVWGTRELHANGDPFWTFRTLADELKHPRRLVCPSDSRSAAANWSSLSNAETSYFLNLDAEQTEPESLLSGDRNIQTNSTVLLPGRVRILAGRIISFDDQIHRFRGNILFSDGSTRRISIWTLTNAATLAIP